MPKALYYQKRDDGRIRCELCPHNCLIAQGRAGICRVRENRAGELALPYYGRISSLAVDPIEKKPLYHFYPGSSIVSAGFWGCNFNCPFCQNFAISQSVSLSSDYLSPSSLVDLAVARRSASIAYTYSEPLIHFEYVLETARRARERGLKNVLVSNGFINEKPALDLLEYLDAANIDLKTWQPDFYKKEIGGRLEDVMRFCTLAAERIHLEVTTLVIPTKNDSPEEIEVIARFLAEIDSRIPFHLSCYYPVYKYTIPPTPAQTVIDLARLARKHLHYVYEGNVGMHETNTSCVSCGNILIRRRGYSVSFPGVKEAKCASCGADIPILGI